MIQTISIAIATAIALLVPVGFLLFLRTFDLHKTAKFQKNIITLVSGLVAYLIATQINPAILNLGLVDSWEEVQVYAAPIVEEILKAIILIYFVSHVEFNYVVDGALYGFGAGIGFAAIENLQYINKNSEIALIVALARVFSTNLMHATGSGLIGTGLAYHRGETKKGRGWLVIIGGYVLAIVVHGVFNSLVNAGIFLPFAILYGVIGGALIFLFIKRGLSTQKQWVEQTLGAEDRVSVQETRAVTSIEQVVEKLIKPFQEQFGDEKVNLVRDMLYRQIEIGIKRKLLDSTPSPTKKLELEAVIKKLGSEMEVFRRQIGTYHMMYVRTVYLDQNYQVWAKIHARIEETRTGQKGGGLFDRATTRIKRKPVAKDQS